MDEKLSILRHSTAHVMASAVKRLFPDAKLGIGPAIENGFYYDFDLEHKFTPDDLEKIEKEMKKIIKEDYKFEQSFINKEEAKQLFQKLGENYKLQLLDEILDEKVSIYRHDDFTDLCKGPHIKSTSEVKAFKLLSIAGAYWKGNEENKMLQRIYGTTFYSQEELENYLIKVKEAQERDHRKLGKQLGYFLILEEAGPGLVFYLPKGAILRSIIEDYIKKEHLKRGYQIVITPQILKSNIWIKSGHYDYYKDYMYIFKTDDTEYAIKPMNCPGHILIYKSQRRSYRDLPLRLFELGNVYRHEKTGVLHGLLRVRGFTQDDAHIFCREDQLKDEIKSVIEFVKQIMKDFGFNEFEIELSTRPDKSIGTDEEWEKATKSLKDSLKELNLEFKICQGEGAFYGPKIDIKLKDAIGRLWQCATIQCDFALPERFGLNYISSDGNFYQPIMLHRVILGSLERFIGTLIEHYKGAFPLWLSPQQVSLLPVSEKFLAYGRNLEKILKSRDIRCSLDYKDETLNYRIRQAEIEKVPYMLIFGKREEEKNIVSVRSRAKGNEGTVDLESFLLKIEEEIIEKKVD
jgi:threonyl-tRNA synthetase